MATVLPTKGNLMATKRSRTLAMTGYELMDRKHNILIREMMALVETAQAIQSEIDQVFTEAYNALQVANIRLTQRCPQFLLRCLRMKGRKNSFHPNTH